MAVATATETQPLLSNPLSRLSNVQKRLIVLAISTTEIIGGIYSAVNTITDHERTSFDWTKFTVSLGLASQGALTSFLCLKGLFPFEFRTSEPCNNATSEPPISAEPQSHEAQVFFNQRLDQLLSQCEIEIPIPDQHAELQAIIEQKCTLLAEYINDRIRSPQAGVDISEIFRSLDALGQIKIAVGSAPPSRSGSRHSSVQNTPLTSPSKRSDETTPPRRRSIASTPSSPAFKALEEGQAGSVKKED